MPFFLNSVVLLALGVLLAKMYPKDIARTKVNVKRLIGSSMDLLIGVTYVALPPLLIYIFFWVILGFFFLIKEIPGIGDFFSVILSFVPFLLIFGSLALCLVNLAILFFVVPAVNLLSVRKGSWIKKTLFFLKAKIFSAIILFFIGSFPLMFVFYLLLISANLTNTNFFMATNALAIAVEWFFMMIPFAAIASPAVVFFFNFSSESYVLMQEKK